MDKSTRNNIQRATQAARAMLERAFIEQLEGTYDILLDGTISERPGSHLAERQAITREKLVAAVMHKRSTGLKSKEAVDAYLREAAFTTLNRFVALKMLEARQLVQECVSNGENSSGFKEFTALAPGLVAVEDKGYRLYIETIFDEIGQEVRVLFDRRDVASLLWPDRQTLLELLGILNAPELASVWAEDETIGWVYQYFNGDEERTKMRAESQAPRNSRELAVRNQFFTPRYVVQFLTDNTLGRTWYEMMKGETKLVDLDYLVRRLNEVFLAEGESAPESDVDDSEFSQEELLQQTVHVPFRAKKDPRDLRILDPACGSGHFLLYAFELLVSIYEEAWGDAEAAVFTETGNRLRADYGSIEDVRRAMPELILRYNLHGVDIDPRAAQIAALALWMRAQRGYNQFDVGQAERPPITKTNIVVAEPMPGDAELVDEFAKGLKPPVLGDLFKKMVGEMKLAGELGSLLKIEESIAKVVKDAEEAHRQEGLFAERIESQDFWDTADEKIIEALACFAESTAGGAGIRRQLFAGDAAQGVAFIELMRKRFDVVLMNPPFGAASRPAKRRFERDYRRTKIDVFAAFVDRGITLLHREGDLGAITSRTGFFLSSFQKWREESLLAAAPPTVFADLGHGVMDEAMVEAAAYCLRRTYRAPYAADFVRVIGEDDRRGALRQLVARATPEPGKYFRIRPVAFGRVPTSPFAYWVSPGLRRQFSILPRFAGESRFAYSGTSTGNDERFVRLWWEVRSVGGRWRHYTKGGRRSPFYSDFPAVIDWLKEGTPIELSYAGGRVRKVHFGREGLTWPLRGIRFSAYAVPRGCIFGTAGKVAIAEAAELPWLLGLLNSAVFDSFIAFFAGKVGGVQYEVGLIQNLPVPEVASATSLKIAEAAQEAWKLKRSLASKIETSHAFTLPALLQVEGVGLRARAANWRRHQKDCIRAIDGLQRRIDAFCADVYQLSKAERRTMNIGSTPTEAATYESAGGGLVPAPLAVATLDDLTVALAADFVMWAIGAIFGRFDVRRTRASASSDLPPDPFRELPSCPPGFLPAGEDQQPGYPVATADKGILVVDNGHPDNLASGLRSIIDQVFAVPTVDWWEQLEATLEPNGVGLNRWLARDLFKHHLDAYSKSRRKAPIYWQLATPSSAFSVWCYYHRLTRDTFFRVVNDYVTPKVDHEERKLNTLRQEAGHDPSSKQRKAIAAQTTFVAELRAFATEVNRIAPLWNPNLNDGVIINFAPLWRLVPQHKQWQKECKKVWDKLVNGDYDWAHLAMYLWPERVVPKCQDDRSLAIAHGLEDDFWYEGDDGKWQKRQVSRDRVEELVAERASTAVKTALKDLLEAPAPSGGTRRNRGKKR